MHQRRKRVGPRKKWSKNERRKRGLVRGGHPQYDTGLSAMFLADLAHLKGSVDFFTSTKSQPFPVITLDGLKKIAAGMGKPTLSFAQEIAFKPLPLIVMPPAKFDFKGAAALLAKHQEMMIAMAYSKVAMSTQGMLMAPSAPYVPLVPRHVSCACRRCTASGRYPSWRWN